jgi:hypothetical protein
VLAHDIGSPKPSIICNFQEGLRHASILVDRSPSILPGRPARCRRRQAPEHRGRARHGLRQGHRGAKEIELDHGVWKVEGRDASGHKIEVRVDSGEAVKMRRND